MDAAFGGFVHPGDQVEHGCFSSPVRANDADQFTGFQFQVEIGNCAQAAKVMRYVISS
jgi:hypothetical protein